MTLEMHILIEEFKKKTGKRNWLLQLDNTVIFTCFEIVILEMNKAALYCGY